ncbi:MAG: hypothetical protein OQK25_03500 [Gammaproteobacteria bacterium]|nr:hypothetical protein [Gammaproteobacteria bacterium]
MSKRWLMALIVTMGWSLQFWVADSRAEERWVVSTTEWAQPRSGEMVSSLKGVRGALSAVIQLPGSIVAIHHPGGDQGIWWAEELKGWLITLGLDSKRVELVPGSGEADMMYLSLIEPKR